MFSPSIRFRFCCRPFCPFSLAHQCSVPLKNMQIRSGKLHRVQINCIHFGPMHAVHRNKQKKKTAVTTQIPDRPNCIICFGALKGFVGAGNGWVDGYGRAKTKKWGERQEAKEKRKFAADRQKTQNVEKMKWKWMGGEAGKGKRWSAGWSISFSDKFCLKRYIPAFLTSKIVYQNVFMKEAKIGLWSEISPLFNENFENCEFF